MPNAGHFGIMDARAKPGTDSRMRKSANGNVKKRGGEAEEEEEEAIKGREGTHWNGHVPKNLMTIIEGHAKMGPDGDANGFLTKKVEFADIFG
jgi:hypothetical protein